MSQRIMHEFPFHTKASFGLEISDSMPADWKARVGLQSAQPLDSDASVLAIAAGDGEGFAGDPAGIGGGEEACHGRNVLRLADAAERSLRFDLLPEAVQNAGGM